MPAPHVSTDTAMEWARVAGELAGALRAVLSLGPGATPTAMRALDRWDRMMSAPFSDQVEAGAPAPSSGEGRAA